MNVREMIEVLSQLDPDREVWVEVDEEEEFKVLGINPDGDQYWIMW